MKLSSKLILISLLVIIVIFSLPFVSSFLKHEKPENTNQITTAAINIDYSNIEEQLSKNNLIKDLPENSAIVLKFLKSDGSKEKSYILKKGSVKEGDLSAPDLIISINSNYISSLTNRNFCDIIKKAYNNGELKIETSLSKASLAWKFKGMMKYKSCLGF